MNDLSQQKTVSVCICTFRRPHLANTLKSVAEQKLSSEYDISVIIADNDETPSAQDLVENIAKSFPYPLHYIHAPSRNISIARNACLKDSNSTYIAFIDDDEIASPEWLSELITQQNIHNATVVLGPMKSHYPKGAPKWLEEGDYHSIYPVWVKGKIITGYTSNVLFLRSALTIANLRFAENLGRSGGEDTAFFSTIYKAGGHIDYASKAIVTEDVASNRLNFYWLFKRYFRSGQTHAMLMLANNKDSPIHRLFEIILASTKVLICFIAALSALFIGRNYRRWILRGSLHIGVVARLLGKLELAQYG